MKTFRTPDGQFAVNITQTFPELRGALYTENPIVLQYGKDDAYLIFRVTELICRKTRLIIIADVLPSYGLLRCNYPHSKIMLEREVDHIL